MSSSSVPINQASAPYDNSTMSDAEREAARIRDAYYAAYDVMTGVRIAATLGGFFGLMVILVVYKSKSKTEKALEDPHVQAVALAEAEEEERQIAAALEQTVYEQLNPAGAAIIAAAAAAHASFSSGSGSGRRIRHSLDTCHSSDRVAPGWIRQTKRFSSVGGYSSLMEPPIRIHKSSGMTGGVLCSSLIIDEDSPPITLVEDGMDVERSCYEDVSTYFNGRNLYVPRRASNITCSSTGSAYLERRVSNILQFTPIPTIRSPSQHGGNRRRQSSPVALGGHPQRIHPYRLCAQSTICSEDGASAGDNNTIDIRVIQPTPGGSPCGSVHLAEDGKMTVEQGVEVQHRRLAPLASISSCNSSTFDATTTDAVSTPPQRRQPRTTRLASNTSSTADYYYPDMDALGTEDTTDTDTVFRDMDCLCHDDVLATDGNAEDDNTDDEVDTFSTDSGDVAGGCTCQQRLLPSPPPTQPLLSSYRQQRYCHPAAPGRRYITSHHATQTNAPRRDFLAEFTSSCRRMIDASSTSVATCHHCHQELVDMELASPVHERTALMSSSEREQCPSCSSPLLMDEERLWTQETLF